MFQLANLVLGLYLVCRCICPLRISRQYKVTGAILVMALIEHHWLVSKIFGTSIPSPELPRPVLLILGTIYGTLLLLAIFILIRDIVGMLTLAFSRRTGAGLLANQRINAALVGLSLATACWGVWQAVKVPSIKQISITVPELEPDMDGYRMVLLTDLHISRLFQRPWVEAVVKETNALKPNLIVISGDLVDGTTDDRGNDVAPLSSLSAPDGIYAVAGNHEYYGDYVQWMSLFKRLGVNMLENQHVIIQPERGGFVLAGVPDTIATTRGQPGPDIAQALASKPSTLPVVLLDHRPGNMHINQTHGVALQLSGHTHGGHIRGVDEVVRRFNNGFVSGKYEVNDAILYVSNGVGLWPGFAIRVGRPAEITEIILRSPSTLQSVSDLEKQ